jgi:hypothetical protein
MAVRTDWKSVWIGGGITLVAGCTVIIWPSQFFAWMGFLTGAVITGFALASHFGGIYFRLAGAAASFCVVALIYLYAPHPPVWEASLPMSSHASTPVPTTLDLFNTDFPNLLKVSGRMTVSPADKEWSEELRFNEYFDFDSNSKFVSVYVPFFATTERDRTFRICVILHNTNANSLKAMEKDKDIIVSGGSNIMRATNLAFSGRIYIYHVDVLDLQQEAALDDIYRKSGLDLQLRGMNYWSAKVRSLHDLLPSR